jgi:hypothetical protein
MRAHPTLWEDNCPSTCRGVIAAFVSLVSVILTSTANADPIVPPGFTIERISAGAFALVQPTGLVVNKDNNIYVGRNFFSKQSDLLQITPSGSVSSIVSFGNFIGGLALNSKGQLFGSLQTETVFRLQNGTASTFTTLPPISIPERLVFDGQDDLFVALFNGRAVSRVSAQGLVATFVENLMGPFGLAFRGDSLFIGDNLNIGNGPGILLEVNTLGTIISAFGPVGDRIVDLEYDPHSDSFFIANQGDFAGSLFGSTILRFQNGTITPFAEGFAEYPRDVVFDSNGNLYVVDATSLYKISPVSAEPIIPEPSSLTLLALGILVLLGWRGGRDELLASTSSGRRRGRPKRSVARRNADSA